MKKSIFVKCVSVVIAVCMCFGFLGNESLAYAASEESGTNQECEYVEFYDEIGDESGISPCSYVCKRTRSLRIIKPGDNSTVADISVTITYEYADNSWVVVHDAALSIQCYQGFLVAVDDADRVFGGAGTDNAFCRRSFMLKGPNGNIASAYIYACADCFGDVHLEFSWDKLYVVGYTVYEY